MSCGGAPRLALPLLALGTSLVSIPALSSSALAKPSIWEGAADPRALKAYRLERLADRNRVSSDPSLDEGQLEEKLNEQAAMMLLMAGGEQLGSPGLLRLLGDCLARAPVAYQPQAVNVLQEAVELEPSHPAAAATWVNLAFASEVLGEQQRAIGAMTQALSLEWRSEARALIYHERGSLQMSAGEVELAVADFTAGLSSGFGAEARALAHWSLGVALDRNHDFPAAIPHLLEGYRARVGPNASSLVIDWDGGTIWPLFERHYYRALALLAEALEHRGQDRDRYLSLLVESQFMWLSYLRESPAEGRWVPRAREHLDWVREQLKQDDAEQDAGLEQELLRPAW